ncbi:MAG: T9SS type A sorting domain-containing protein [bacterium]
MKQKIIIILFFNFLLSDLLIAENYQMDTSSVFKILAMPNPQISGGGNSACEGSNVTYQSNADASVSYKWEVTGGTINGASNQQNVTVNWGTGSNGTLKLIHLKSSGCNDSTTKNITINPAPNPQITGGSNFVCAESQTTYTGTVEEVATNLWIVSGGTINGSNDGSLIEVNWGTGTNGKVKLIQTNSASGCQDSAEMSIMINPLPKPQISNGLSSVCEESQSSYVGTIDANLTNLWEITGGKIFGPADSSAVNVIWGTGTSGSVKLIQTNSVTGCKDSISMNIEIKPVPSKPIISDTTIAYDGTAVLKPKGPPNCTYRWYKKITDITPFAVKDTLELKKLKKDTILYVESFNLITACFSNEKTKVTITVSPEGALILDMKEKNVSICQGDSVLIGLKKEMTGDNPPYNYHWSPVSGLSNPNFFETWAKPESSTEYILTVKDKNDNSGTSNVMVTVFPLPEVTFNCDDNEFCLDEEEFVINGGTPVGGVYLGVGVEDGIFHPSTAGLGKHEINYIFTSEDGCTKSATDIFEVFPLPEKPKIQETSKLLYSTYASSYQWYLENEAIPDAVKQTYKPDKTGTYKVEISDEHGCSNISDDYYFDITDVKNDVLLNQEIRIYPNPATDYIEITVGAHCNVPLQNEVHIYNIFGECLLSVWESRSNRDNVSLRIDISEFFDGIYFVRYNNSSSTFVKY